MKNKVYSYISNEIRLELIKEYPETANINIFIRLLVEDYKDWIISINELDIDITGLVKCRYIVCRVPCVITEDDITAAIPHMDNLMEKIMHDMIMSA